MKENIGVYYVTMQLIDNQAEAGLDNVGENQAI